jgi:hypothetical protein
VYKSVVASRRDHLHARSSIIIAVHIAVHTTGDDPQSPVMIGDQKR